MIKIRKQLQEATSFIRTASEREVANYEKKMLHKTRDDRDIGNMTFKNIVISSHYDEGANELVFIRSSKD